jgi:hypothetical protein
VAAGREAIPAVDAYYEVRHAYFNQGDIFRDVPFVYPFPIEESGVEDGGSRNLYAGPIENGLGMLISPTCSMQAQGRPPGAYAHPARALVPVVALDRLVNEGSIKASALPQLRQYDNLINYMYLPASESCEIVESVALLWLPMTIHHAQIDGLRVAQLGEPAAQQLQRKLQWFFTGLVDPRSEFEPQLD